jgi:carbonic anhydrase
VFVQDAWARGQSLAIHGWVYSLADGLVKDLEVTVGRAEELERLR